MDGAVFSCREIVVIRVGREINGETTRHYEGHTAGLLLRYVSTRVDVLLIGVCFPLEYFQLSEFEAFLHRPFNNAAITGDRNKEFTLILLLDPLQLPNNISMLAFKVLAIK